jgi:hypothetical protein
MAQSTFEKLYRTNDYDITNNVELTADGGYILVGQSGPVYDTCTCDMFLVKCDAEGNIQWSNRYATVFCDQGWDVKQTSDQGYVLTGLIIDTAGSSFMVLMKTDSLGAIIWQYLYESNLHDQGNSLHLLSDGGFLVTGYRYNPDLYGYDITLTRFDSAGNVIWSRFYLTPGAGYGQIQLFDNGDGTYYLVAVEVLVNSFPIHEDFVVMRVNEEGEIISSRTYGNPEDNEKGWGIIRVAPNRYWLIGTGGQQNHTDALLTEIDSSGNVIWSKVYDSGIYLADESSVTSFSYIPEYGLFICGFDAFYNPFTFLIDLSDAFVFRVTDDGTVSWWHDFGTPETYYWEEFRRMKIAADGGLLLAGSRTTYGNYDESEHWDMYVAKVDAAGKSGCEMAREVNVTDFDIGMNDYPVIDSSITLSMQPAAFASYPAGEMTILCAGLPTGLPSPVENNSITLFPNPADREVAVTAGFDEVAELRIADFTGRVLLRQPHQSSTVSVEFLPDGLYIAQVVSGAGKSLYSGKLMILHEGHHK